MLVESSRQRSLQHVAVAGSADRLQERVDGTGLVACVVELEGCLSDARSPRAWHRKQGRLQHGEGVHDIRGIQGQLQADVRAGGVSDHVRSLDPEVLQQRSAVGTLLRETDRSLGRAAARAADAMVGEQAVLIGEDRLGQQRHEPVGKVPRVDQYYRLAASPVVELKATNNNALYTFSFLLLLYFAVFSVVSARERRWFWSTMPSKALLGALVADVLVGTLLTRANLPGLMPLPWWQMVAIFAYAVASCLILNDTVKVAMIKRIAPAVADTAVGFTSQTSPQARTYD